MKIVMPKYYEGHVKYEKIPEVMSGDITYLGDTCVRGSYEPVILLNARKPDLEKGHKPFPFLFFQGGSMMIGGLTEEEFNSSYRYQDAKHCTKCDEVIYSAYRHDCRHCSCGDVMIDGGRDYTRCSLNGVSGRIDFLTGQFLANGSVVPADKVKKPRKPRAKKTKQE